MKKLILSFALLGLALPVAAQEAIHLSSGSQLNASSVSQVLLQDGESKDNVWFAIDPAEFSGSSEKQLSNCVLTARLTLDQGELQFTSRNLRCPSKTGDVFHAEEVQVELLTSVSQVCTASGSYCTEVTLSTSAEYQLQLQDALNLEAVYNPSREANRMRIEEQQAN